MRGHGAWGGVGSRGGYHLRGGSHPTPQVCPECGTPMVLEHPQQGRFLVPGTLPEWKCPQKKQGAGCCRGEVTDG